MEPSICYLKFYIILSSKSQLLAYSSIFHWPATLLKKVCKIFYNRFLKAHIWQIECNEQYRTHD